MTWEVQGGYEWCPKVVRWFPEFPRSMSGSPALGRIFRNSGNAGMHGEHIGIVRIWPENRGLPAQGWCTSHSANGHLQIIYSTGIRSWIMFTRECCWMGLTGTLTGMSSWSAEQMSLRSNSHRKGLARGLRKVDLLRSVRRLECPLCDVTFLPMHSSSCHHSVDWIMCCLYSIRNQVESSTHR